MIITRSFVRLLICLPKNLIYDNIHLNKLQEDGKHVSTI